MNCDQAFELLTRDADSVALPDDPQLEAHLARCADCRHLAAAILPAVEALREPGPSTNMVTNMAPVTGPWDNDRAVVEPSPVRAMAAPPAQHASAAPRWSIAPFLHLAAAVLIGVALAGAIYGDKPGSSTTSPAGPQAAAPLTPAALWGTLSDNCRAEHRRLTGGSAALVCCTECHAARHHRARPAVDMAKLLLSCQVCHAN